MNKQFRVEEVKPLPKKGIHYNKEEIAKYISRIASTVYDRDEVMNPIKRFDKLMVEAYGDTASSVLGFVPCVLNSGDESDSYVKIFGYFSKVNGDLNTTKYHTSLRELLKWGYSLEEALEYVDFTNYKAYKILTPYFIFGQISRHTEMNVISHSQRYAVSKHGYWMPDEFIEYHNKSATSDVDIQVMWDDIVSNTSPFELREFMKDIIGIKRKEIYDRGSDMLENRAWCLGGYGNNPYQWEWLINQRTDKHTQLETRDLVEGLREMLL